MRREFLLLVLKYLYVFLIILATPSMVYAFSLFNGCEGPQIAKLFSIVLERETFLDDVNNYADRLVKTGDVTPETMVALRTAFDEGRIRAFELLRTLKAANSNLPRQFPSPALQQRFTDFLALLEPSRRVPVTLFSFEPTSKIKTAITNLEKIQTELRSIHSRISELKSTIASADSTTKSLRGTELEAAKEYFRLKLQEQQTAIEALRNDGTVLERELLDQIVSPSEREFDRESPWGFTSTKQFLSFQKELSGGLKSALGAMGCWEDATSKAEPSVFLEGSAITGTSNQPRLVSFEELQLGKEGKLKSRSLVLLRRPYTAPALELFNASDLDIAIVVSRSVMSVLELKFPQLAQQARGGGSGPRRLGPVKARQALRSLSLYQFFEDISKKYGVRVDSLMFYEEKPRSQDPNEKVQLYPYR